MAETDNRQQREEVFSIVVRAGKRTYFFDVKETRAKEKYLTITESKRRFSNDSAKFFYEKHKIFLYKEDFEKFSDGLAGVIDFIKSSGPDPEIDAEEQETGFDTYKTETALPEKETEESEDFDAGTYDQDDDAGDEKDDQTEEKDKY
jgi:hypothetical protein